MVPGDLVVANERKRNTHRSSSEAVAQKSGPTLIFRSRQPSNALAFTYPPALNEWALQMGEIVVSLTRSGKIDDDEISRRTHDTMTAIARYRELCDRAIAGDNGALAQLFVDNGIEMFDDEPIRQRVYEMLDADHPDRKTLAVIARVFARRFRVHKRTQSAVNTTRYKMQLIVAVRAAYERCRHRLKTRYNSEQGKRTAHQKLSAEIAQAVPTTWRKRIAEAAEKVLGASRQRPGKGFAVNVVAEALSVSSRRIRSIQTDKQFRNN